MLGPDGNVMMGLDGQPMMSTTTTVTVRKKDKSGRVAIECVPPEEFIVSKKAVFGQEKMPFCAHRRLVPRTELVQMGFDKDEVYSLPQFNSLDFTEERTRLVKNRLSRKVSTSPCRKSKYTSAIFT